MFKTSPFEMGQEGVVNLKNSSKGDVVVRKKIFKRTKSEVL